MSKSHKSSSKRRFAPDYPLQGTKLDLPLASVVSLSPEKRRVYIRRLLSALAREIKRDTMSVKIRKPFKDEMRDLRKLLHARADKFLYTDEKTWKRNVLGKGSYGSSHTFWSRHHMWKMKTKGGDLAEDIINKNPALIRKLETLLDQANLSKEVFRNYRKTTVQNVLFFLQVDRGVGTAFPPHHAKFFADKFLPKDGDGVVFDPCAGWGGRLLGSLCVNRTGHVHYYGVDPETRNKDAYDGLERRINHYLKRELKGTRSATLYYRPFEVFIKTRAAKKLFGRCDLVLTSSPYFDAENYNPQNAKQSSNKYATYEQWRTHFYRPLMKGAFDLLKEGGVFVLNIANVSSAKSLEKDARILAREVGFESETFFKMALTISPATRKSTQKAPRHSVVVNGKTFKHEPVFVFRRPAKNGAVSQSVTTISQRSVPTSLPKTVAPPPTPKNTKEALKMVFRRYKKSMRNPYSLFSTRISAGLKDRTLHYCKAHGSIVAAFLARKRKVSGKGFMYLGTTPSVHAINKLKGDLDIEAISLLDETPSSQEALLKELSAVRGPVWGECVASDKMVSQILRKAGFSYVTSSVNAFSDVVASYFKGTAQERKQRTVAVDEAQIVNLKRLPVGNVSPLVRKIAARLNKKKLHFTSHNSNYNRNDAWTALTLRGYLPDSTYIHDPEEARRGTSEKDLEELKKWEKRYAKRYWGLQDTKLMKQFPEVQELLDTLVPDSSKNGNSAFKRVRLMRLKPQGGELTRHVDITDGTLGLDDGKSVRIHFPIKTNPKVLLTSWDLHDQPIEKHFPVGECWYLNIRFPHKIVNGGTEDRFHLVVDGFANERIRDLIAGKQHSETQRPVIVKHSTPSVAARLAQSVKSSFFTVGEVTEASFKKSGVDRKRLHNVLRTMGRDWLHKKSIMKWSPDNPTKNYCYTIAEWVQRYIAPAGSTTFRVMVDGDPYGHRFNVYPDGSIVDLAAEQFGADATIPYYTSRVRPLLVSGGKHPSKRAQMLNHLYKGGSLSDFCYSQKRAGDWSFEKPCEKSKVQRRIEKWRDPYPKPKLEQFGDYIVVRDDLLSVGSKARFLDAMIRSNPEVQEWVFGSSPAQGYGQVSLAAACQKAKRRAVLFVAQRSLTNLTDQQKKGLELGAIYRWVPNGMLQNTAKHARKYVAKDPKRRRLLPIGFNTEPVVAAIVQVAKKIKKERTPKEIWTVGSSGTLSRGLQMAFPNAQVNVVSVGHRMSFNEVGRARLWKHPFPFERSVKPEQAPPYPSIPNYDSKVWSFVCAYAKKGAWIWNVAGNEGELNHRS